MVFRLTRRGYSSATLLLRKGRASPLCPLLDSLQSQKTIITSCITSHNRYITILKGTGIEHNSRLVCPRAPSPSSLGQVPVDPVGSEHMKEPDSNDLNTNMKKDLIDKFKQRDLSHLQNVFSRQQKATSSLLQSIPFLSLPFNVDSLASQLQSKLSSSLNSTNGRGDIQGMRDQLIYALGRLDEAVSRARPGHVPSYEHVGQSRLVRLVERQKTIQDQLAHDASKAIRKLLGTTAFSLGVIYLIGMLTVKLGGITMILMGPFLLVSAGVNMGWSYWRWRRIQSGLRSSLSVAHAKLLNELEVAYRRELDRSLMGSS